MSAPSAAAFLRKRKDKRPGPSRFPPNGAAASSSAGPSNSTAPRPIPVPAPIPKSEPSATGTPTADRSRIVEIKLFSAPASSLRDSRFNLMKFNYSRDYDPTSIPRPILLNRKQPGPRAPPTFAFDEEGEIIGKYKYDEEGKPVLGENGLQVIETKEKADLSLIGGSEQKKVRKKAIKEVYHQEKDVMRLRREEATPWILESGNPSPDEGQTGGKLPEHWVGRYVDPHSLPTVLFVNDGNSDGFQVIPLGRTYKFEPERPFKVLDPDASHKLFEFQAKHKAHDRWALRQDSAGPLAVQPNGAAAASQIKRERGLDSRQEKRARAMEDRMLLQGGVKEEKKPKVERFDDDNKREGRGLKRGLEGGAEEELDYDEKEDFQDDDDVNTFYRDPEEEAEAKATDDRLKKEYRIANATVGDRPQIQDELEEEIELFGKEDLTKDGKKLRRMMRKRQGSEDLFGDSDEDSDDSEEETPDKKAKEKEKEAEKAKGKEPGSSERPSRPPSRGPGNNRSERGATSPGNSTRHQSPTPIKGKSSTAPPVSGASFMAQRATGRGVSPAARSRNTSPRAGSPDSAGGARSPRAGSPATTGRAQSPTAGTTRESSPSGTVPRIKLKNPSASASGSAAGSPAPSPNTKRKPSPVSGANDPPRKKKKGSNTPTPAPEDIEPFEGMITKEEIIRWFRSQPSDRVPMSEVIKAFKPRLVEPATQELRDMNTKVFMGWVGAVTVKGTEKTLQFKAEYQKG